jgi:tRNA threonylcarbamoyladenosine modification (KEOPS) complex Cgi121 subunit
MKIDGKERRKCTIGICGLAGCIVPKNIGDLFGRLKSQSSAQALLGMQLFDSDKVATHFHILVSTLYALQAFDNGKNISNTIGTEILLYASAQRQIVNAIEKIGVKPETSNIAVVAISLNEDGARQTLTATMKQLAGQMDDSVLSINTLNKTRIIRKIFGITEEELNASSMRTDPEDVERAITRRVLSRISIMAISK